MVSRMSNEEEIVLLTHACFQQSATIINVPVMESKYRSVLEYERNLSNPTSGTGSVQGNENNNNIPYNFFGMPVNNDFQLLLTLLGTLNPLLSDRFFRLYQEGTMEDVPTPLSEEQLGKLQRMKFCELTPGMIDNREIENICTICQDTINTEDNVVLLPCQGKHYFHDNCVNEWLSKFSKNYPILRKHNTLIRFE